jgi:hypothetical protein
MIYPVTNFQKGDRMVFNDIDLIDRTYQRMFFFKLSALHITEQVSFNNWVQEQNRTYDEWITYWQHKVPELTNQVYYHYYVTSIDPVNGAKWLQEVGGINFLPMT